MSRYWILDGKKAVPVGLIEWSRWLETGDRVVRSTETELHWISTVFVGLDMSFDETRPLLFETMVFSRETHPRPWFGTDQTVELHDSYDCLRWSTWDEAVAGHDRLVREWTEREASASLCVVGPKKEAG